MKWILLTLLLLPSFANGLRTQETHLLQDKMIDIGYSPELSKYIIDQCKEIETEEISARHCVNRATAIGVAESSAGTKAYKNNMFGFRNRTYENFYNAFDDWVASYQKYRWKHQTSDGWIKRSRYCVDEINNALDCPNRRKNTTNIMSLLNDVPVPKDQSIAEDDIETVLSYMK